MPFPVRGGRGREIEWERQCGGFVWSTGSEKMNVPLCVMNMQLGVSGGGVVDLAQSSRSAYQPASSQPVGECSSMMVCWCRLAYECSSH